MAISVRTRFEVFKRDDFTCRYCGKKSPDVILEVDHIVSVAEGGTDDPINLATSCWACNSGKSCVPLNQVMTGEDPHDKAIALLEQERQLREYAHVTELAFARRESDAQELVNFWCDETKRNGISTGHFAWLINTLAHTPPARIKEAMWAAIGADATRDLRYVMAVVRNWRAAENREPDDDA